ncbi:MAG: hypothetical protein M1829_001639 [Trizodia sp. TS-e1964]|nr:MAG: hypothetical protein M1829_001639 [Trizodia sp. TS-e1964]
MVKESLFKNIIKIRIGPDEVDFPVYRDLIVLRSPSFKETLSGDELESVAFPGFKPEIFESFILGLNTKIIEDDIEGLGYPYWLHMVELYDLADTFEVLELKNSIISKCLKRCSDERAFDVKKKMMFSFDDAAIMFLDRNTSGDDRLRRVFVDLIAFSAHKELKKRSSLLPKGIMLGVMVELAAIMSGDDKIVGSELCGRYHEHNDTTPVNSSCQTFATYGTWPRSQTFYPSLQTHLNSLAYIMLFSSSLPLLVALVPLALADVLFTSPAAGITLAGGTSVTVQWRDSGSAPSITDLTSYQIFLCTGSNDSPVQLVSLTPSPGTFSSGPSAIATIPTGVGGNTANA